MVVILFFIFYEQCNNANCVASVVLFLILLRIASQLLSQDSHVYRDLKLSALAKLITARYTPSILGYRTSDHSNLVGADATKQINTEAMRPECVTQV